MKIDSKKYNSVWLKFYFRKLENKLWLSKQVEVLSHLKSSSPVLHNLFVCFVSYLSLFLSSNYKHWKSYQAIQFEHFFKILLHLMFNLPKRVYDFGLIVHEICFYENVITLTAQSSICREKRRLELDKYVEWSMYIEW